MLFFFLSLFFFFLFFFFFFFFAVLFRASNVVWHCISTRQQHTTPYSSSPTTASRFSLAFHVPRFKPSRTLLGWVGQTCSRQSERPWKLARVVWGTRAPAGVSDHPSASDSQSDPVHAQEMLSSYWFSRRTNTLLIWVSPSRKTRTDWTVSWMRTVLK